MGVLLLEPIELTIEKENKEAKDGQYAKVIYNYKLVSASDV